MELNDQTTEILMTIMHLGRETLPENRDQIMSENKKVDFSRFSIIFSGEVVVCRCRKRCFYVPLLMHSHFIGKFISRPMFRNGRGKKRPVMIQIQGWSACLDEGVAA